MEMQYYKIVSATLAHPWALATIVMVKTPAKAVIFSIKWYSIPDWYLQSGTKFCTVAYIEN